MTALELEWHASILASKESVSVEIARWAKRRIMNNKNRLEGLLEIARAAGVAEGYAKAKYEMAREALEQTN